MRSGRESGLISSLPCSGRRRVLLGRWGRIGAWVDYAIYGLYGNWMKMSKMFNGFATGLQLHWTRSDWFDRD